jgi:hypothetical protein
MFTGIVTDVGEVATVEGSQGTLKRLRIHSAYDPATITLGASIACGGPCLTVVAFGPREGGCWFDVDAAAETLERTTVGDWQAGTKVNLERALKIGDELGGIERDGDGGRDLERAVQGQHVHGGLGRLDGALRTAQQFIGDVVVEAGFDDQDAGAGNRRTGALRLGGMGDHGRLSRFRKHPSSSWGGRSPDKEGNAGRSPTLPGARPQAARRNGP